MNWLNDNVNALALLGAAAIIILSVFVVGKYLKQMKTDKSTGELAKERVFLLLHTEIFIPSADRNTCPSLLSDSPWGIRLEG